MTLARIVGAETLDHLAENDPTAMRSRRDLRRVHVVMGTQHIILHGLHHLMLSRTTTAPLSILELGAGDGSLMLGVAKKLTATWPKVELTLLDRQTIVDSDTIASYAKLSWAVKLETIDVLDWAQNAPDTAEINQATKHYDMIVANLFLHHFESAHLSILMHAIATRCDQFLACEPRRSWLALAGSHLIGLIGANKVTREDAVLSVHAGFCTDELTLLWPKTEFMTNQYSANTWQLLEYAAGLFSHCFSANKLKAHQ